MIFDDRVLKYSLVIKHEFEYFPFLVSDCLNVLKMRALALLQ